MWKEEKVSSQKIKSDQKNSLVASNLCLKDEQKGAYQENDPADLLPQAGSSRAG